MEIKGKFATAISYAKEIEPIAEEQIRTMCDQQFTEGCRIRIMPDVHAGIIDAIREAVDIVEIIKPVYNFKAAEK